MTQTFIPRALAAGARLAAGTRVARLVRRDARVAGAVTSRGLVTAEHVWVCAGAIGTAALLQRSGFRRGVGARLSMHPTIKLAARFAEPLDAASDIPVHQVKPPNDRLSLGGSASRPGYVALALADDWGRNRALAEDWRCFGVYYAAIRPDGHGRVLAVPGLSDPLVTFALTRADIALLGEGLVALARLLLAAGAESVHPGVRDGGVVTRPQDAARLQATVTRSAASLVTLHLFSTVPMGEDPSRCPVDSFGRMRGVRGLRVNDAALLPGAPGLNPQGTVMAVAARNVAEFLAA
jgi:choline dehydrogenase-like flavoprotein